MMSRQIQEVSIIRRSSRRVRRSSHILPTGLLAGLVATIFMFLQPATALTGQSGNFPKILRVGISSRVFPDIDPRDAQVAMAMWARELSRSMGLRTSPETIIFGDMDELQKAIRKGKLNIVNISSLDYLKLRGKVPLIPIIVPVNNTGKSREQVLITRNDSGIRKVSDLRGKTVLLLPKTKHEPSHIWLDVLMLKEGIREKTPYFCKIKELSTPSQAIMNVFFRQAEAAIVSRGALETSAALNPQIGKQLIIIATSDSLLGDISCIPSTKDEKLRHTIENAAFHLHESAIGQQMFTLFQIDRVIPYKPAYLEGLAKLLKEQALLKAKTAKRR
jgi:ABC-type phosphate/phosphonate transport system substrate-binding protein